MAILAVIFICVVASIYMLMYQLGGESMDKPHLPAEAMKDEFGANTVRLYIDTAPKSWTSLTKRYKSWDQKLKMEKTRRKLIQAGYPMGLVEFFFLQVLSLVGVPALTFILLSSFKIPTYLIFTASLAVGYMAPIMWLRGRINKRQHKIRKDLPNIIDLLNLCVGGGMDFMLAVNRVLKELKPGEFSRELAVVIHEVQMGKTRREALKDLAWRLDMPEIHSFARTLVQADRMGSPLAEALRLQAEEVRMRRFHRGEAMALKAPIKLLLPLFVFILPVVLIIVAGPILLGFIRGGGAGMGF